jgi:hypothetical protein
VLYFGWFVPMVNVGDTVVMSWDTERGLLSDSTRQIALRDTVSFACRLEHSSLNVTPGVYLVLWLVGTDLLCSSVSGKL